jgi:hypothetical protein
VPRRRNLLPLVGFVVCAIGLLSYPLFFVQFPLTRDLAWANWLLFALGLGLAGAGLRRAFRRPGALGRISAVVLASASVAVLGFFVFMTEIWSRDLPPAANAPAVGAKAPDLSLPDASGRTLTLGDLLAAPAAQEAGSWLLLIFYRGHW